MVQCEGLQVRLATRADDQGMYDLSRTKHAGHDCAGRGRPDVGEIVLICKKGERVSGPRIKGWGSPSSAFLANQGDTFTTKILHAPAKLRS